MANQKDDTKIESHYRKRRLTITLDFGPLKKADMQ